MKGIPIEKLALKGNATKIKFPRAYLSNNSFDFSFSGLKTAVALYIKKWHKDKSQMEDVTPADIAASFQESVVDVLVHKVMRAREKVGAKALVVAGGVACNKRLRSKLAETASNEGTRVYFPRPEYCTDNGAMIAVAGYQRLVHGERADLSMDVRSKYPISDITPLAAQMDH